MWKISKGLSSVHWFSNWFYLKFGCQIVIFVVILKGKLISLELPVKSGKKFNRLWFCSDGLQNLVSRSCSSFLFECPLFTNQRKYKSITCMPIKLHLKIFPKFEICKKNHSTHSAVSRFPSPNDDTKNFLGAIVGGIIEVLSIVMKIVTWNVHLIWFCCHSWYIHNECGFNVSTSIITNSKATIKLGKCLHSNLMWKINQNPSPE